MSEAQRSAEQAFSAYVEAAMVACPRCKVAVGKPCVEGYCKNGYRNCQFAICHRWREAAQPHLERAVKARQQISTPPAVLDGGDPS